MKNALTKLLATGLLALTLAGAAWSQGGGTNTNSAVIDRPPTETERRMAQDKLDAEISIARNHQDAIKMMVHDLAWNSWVLMVLGIFFFGYLKNKRRHETIRHMVEKGVPITPEVLAALGRRRRRNVFGVMQGDDNRASHDPNGYLAWGITLVAVGIAVLVVAGKWGWIVLLIGVADLILWVIERFTSSANGKKS